MALGAVLALAARAQDEDAQENYVMPDGRTIPPVETIDERHVSIGKAVIDKKEKSVSFPAFINMNEGLIEYIACMPHGKVHEALLITETDPLHVSLAMKLLRFKAFETFFPMRDENLEWLPFTPPEPKDYANAYIDIRITWKDAQGKERRTDLSDFIANSRTKKPFPAGDWLYTNSFFFDGRYQASLSGDVIAIFADRTSPINYIGEFNKGDNDSGWIANPEHTPEPGTPVTVTITQPARPQTTPQATP